MNKHIIYRILCACLLLLLHLVPAPTAHAAFPVTSTADSGPGSLRQAIINANATPELDVIEFGLSGCPCTITLQTALPEIVYPLEIYGLLSADQVTISGNNAVRVFKVASTGSLSLWRVTVASGLSAGGSAIHNSGSVDIHDSVFSNNSVTGDWSVGGAIYNRGLMNISNSMFSGNRSPTTNDGKGGAIFNHDEGALTLSGSNFTSNSAGQDGGAIYNGGEMTATNGTFSGNTAYYDGGAIYNIARSIDIVDCTFSGNHASAGKGGAIYNWSGYHGGSASVTITNTTFSNNTANERGGAIDNYVYDGTARVTITDSTFSQNSSWKGGAISNHRYITLGAKVDIADSTFSNNRAVGGGDGGAIHNAGDEVTVSRSVFSGNRTEGWGGAISSSGTLRIDQSSFINNVVLVEAIGYAGGGGAAISNLGGNATVTNSTFSGNTSDSRGCIYNQDGSLKVTDSTFSGNNADGEGGAINNYRFTSTTNATVTNCTLSGNGARQGGNLYDFNGTLTLRNSIVANSTRGGNCSGTVTDGGGNLRWPASDTSCVGTYSDPKLSPLADNGGPTETMALQSGSMAVGAGDDAICALTPPDGPGGKDQRGVAHVEVCDAGAYESPYHKSTVSITSDAPDPSVVGQQAEVGFSVAAFYQGQPTPTGSVTVRDGTVSCVGQLSNDGTGSCTMALASVGARTLTATYSGDDVFNGGSDTEPHQVDRADTTTVISSHLPNPSIMSQPVQVNVAVSANLPGSGTPGGSVLVAVLGEAFCWATLTNGAGNCSLTFASPGTKSITANYGGDANFNGSASAPVSHRVKANTTTVITSDTPEPSVVGQTVTVTSTVTSGAGTPTGSVTVNDGAEASCVANLSNGSGSCTLTPTSAGNKTLTATYGGDIDFNGSSDTEPHQVNQADTTTTIISDTPEPSVVGQPVTVQYSVTVDSPGSGTPTGQVTVSDGAGASCTDTVAAGSCTLTPTSAGDKTLTAIYEGDDQFMSSSDTEPHQVNRADSTTAISTHNPDPSVVGQAVVVSYTLTANPPGGGTPTGDVTVSDGDGNSCVATVAAGGCVLTPTIAGSKTLTATYAGDGNFNLSSGSASHTVNQADTTTALSSSPNPSVAGQLVTFIATVTANAPGSGTPTGMVTLREGATVLGSGTLDASGRATLRTNALTAGSHAISAEYSGDGNFHSSTGILSPDQKVEIAKTCLPLIVRKHVSASDLVVERIIATGDQVQVVIRNQGNVAVPDDPAHEFWVDLYINPSHKPGYNETCQTMGCEGAAWGITWSGSPYSPPDELGRRALPLEPGEVFTLTTGGDYYWPSKSNITWPLTQGDRVYAQVDSSNATTSYGAVMESDESNNISDPPATVPGAGIAPLPVTTEKPERDIAKTSLPPRP